MTFNKKIIFLVCASILFITAYPCIAQYGLEETGKTAGIPENLRSATPASLMGQIIGVGLGLVGVIFLALMVYGGFLWMTARGDEKQATQAKDLIFAAIIGIIIIAAAYVITNFVIGALTSG